MRHKLLGSKADKTRYAFANSAEQANEVGVHISMEKVGQSQQKTNVFLDGESALRLYLGLRDSLRHMLTELSDQDKMALKVLVERDAWGLVRFTDRKSHVAEDLGF